MNGLKNILLKIEEDGSAEAARIEKEAILHAEEYKAGVLETAKAEAGEIAADAEKKAAVIDESAKSGCEAYIKRQELAARAQVINDFIGYAAEKIDGMDDGEYFDTLEKLIVKYAQNGEGELILNKKDSDRMPQDFMEKVNKEIKNGSVKKSAVTDDKIKSGFIIRYGEIEQNCTFEALLEEKKDETKDAVFRLIGGAV